MTKVTKKEIILYILGAIVFVIALSVLMAVRVQSRSREATLFDNRNYEAAEAAYKQQVQQVLENYDCYNSGLTMTRIVSMDGEREYSMQIYNGRLRMLEKDVYEKLCNDVEQCKVLLPDGREYEVDLKFEA